MFEPLLSIGSRVGHIFRVLGKFEFVRRLHDFLLHEGRRSRAETLEQTAKVVLVLEKAEAQRLKNSRTLLDLMKAAGFSEEKIQATLSNPIEMNRVSGALTTMLQYVDTGIVSISVVQTQEPEPFDVPVGASSPFRNKPTPLPKFPKKRTKRINR